jgi:hypothetical protein
LIGSANCGLVKEVKPGKVKEHCVPPFIYLNKLIDFAIGPFSTKPHAII